MKRPTELPPRCPACDAWADAPVRWNGRGYCPVCGADVDDPRRPGIDWDAPYVRGDDRQEQQR